MRRVVDVERLEAYCQRRRCGTVELSYIKETATLCERCGEPARWLHRKRNGYAVLVCSACEREKEGYTRTAYCPHCGRPMTGEGEQE